MIIRYVKIYVFRLSSKLLLQIPETNYYNKENMQKISNFNKKVPIPSSSLISQTEVFKVDKNKIILKVKNLNLSQLKDNDIKVILYNDNFPTLRTLKVKAIEKKLEVILMSEEEIFLNKQKSKVFLKLDDKYIVSKVYVKDFKNNYNIYNKKIYFILITAFFAGFVLNFMPCVLPVLGIKSK